MYRTAAVRFLTVRRSLCVRRQPRAYLPVQAHSRGRWTRRTRCGAPVVESTRRPLLTSAPAAATSSRCHRAGGRTPPTEWCSKALGSSEEKELPDGGSREAPGAVHWKASSRRDAVGARRSGTALRRALWRRERRPSPIAKSWSQQISSYPIARSLRKSTASSASTHISVEPDPEPRCTTRCAPSSSSQSAAMEPSAPVQDCWHRCLRVCASSAASVPSAGPAPRCAAPGPRTRCSPPWRTGRSLRRPKAGGWGWLPSRRASPLP